MSGILGAISSVFSWTFPAANSAVTLVLGGIIGWGIRELLSDIHHTLHIELSPLYCILSLWRNDMG